MSTMSEKEQACHDEKAGWLASIPARYVICIMCFTAMTIECVLKVCLSVVIVAMVHRDSNSTKLPQPVFVEMADRIDFMRELDVCPGKNEEETVSQGGEFDWDQELQGWVLSAHAYGVLVTHLIGGRLSEIFGVKYILGPSVLVCGLLSILSPVSARWGAGAFITIRILLGAVSGVVMPAMSVIFAKWFPVEERTSMAGIIMGSVPLGTIIAMSLSGILADIYGWDVVFYIYGIVAVVWFVPWILLVHDTPEKHPRITQQEKELILASLGRTDKMCLPVPWVAILTSLPLWAHVIMGTGYAWIGATLLSELPTYLSTILHFDLKKSGIISSLPFLFSPIGAVFFGFMSQLLRSRGYVSHLNGYRIFNTISAVGSCIFIFIITLVGCDATAIIVLLIFSVIAMTAYLGGSVMNGLDLGSNFAGTVSGISSTVSGIAGICTPMIVGVLTDGNETITQWHIVFYIAISVVLSSYIVFMLFGSVEEQPWNRPPSEDCISEGSTISDRKLEEV